MDATTDDGWFSADAATFGDRVTGAREARGMSRKQLAERLGIRVKTLESWEEDNADPRSNKLQMLAGVLGVSLMWLLTGEGEGVDGSEVEDTPDAVEARAVMAEARQIRAEMGQLSDRMARLEKRLRVALATASSA